MTTTLKPAERVNICGVGVDSFSFSQVLDHIVDHVVYDKTPEYVVTPNAYHLLLLQQDQYFRDIYQDAFLSVPDGVPLLWAAKFLGTPLTDRVNGTDLFEQLCAIAARRNLKVFLLGGRPGAADKAKEVLQNRHPSLKIVGTCCPSYGFEANPMEIAQINAQIVAAAPDILFVGLGAPKQEKWIHQNYQQLGVPVSLGIGVSFELVADMVRRAPRFMQKTGLEWLFRLLVEPRRLWQRYILGNPMFVWLVLKQRLQGLMR
ncbi:MAG: WecB/TagA/CpsF family glycosyltransferase [Synechococcales bacterium]|nr:WecB/TagA/CpsF family glycosyltransferase [Synechococcales bacterium]